MIARIWHGWTTRENAEKYEKLLREEVLLEIAKRAIPGYKGAEIFIRDAENDEVEFITLLRFGTVDAVKTFAGNSMKHRSSHRNARSCSSARAINHGIIGSFRS